MAYPWGSGVSFQELKTFLAEKHQVSFKRLPLQIVNVDGGKAETINYFERALADGTVRRTAVSPGLEEISRIPTLELFLIAHNLDIDLEDLGYDRYWQECYIEALELDEEKERALKETL
jgi:hypothetical protein